MTEQRRVTALTAESQPSFLVPADWSAKQIDNAIAALYGQQDNGLPHNWKGDEVGKWPSLS